MKALFRVDASKQIGIGHLMRCLTLADALGRRNCDSVFLTKDYDGIGVELIKKNGFKKIERIAKDMDLRQDFNKLRMLALEHKADFVVVDSYAFNNKYYYNIHKSGLKLLVIGDSTKKNIAADIILNQNIYANQLTYYPLDRNTKLLLGPRYALLKRDFRLCRNRYKPSKFLRNVLLTLGGSNNNDNCVIKIVKAIKQLKEHKLNLKIIGRVAPVTKSFIKEHLNNSGIKYKLKETVTDIWEIMLWADLTVCGGGTTTYELCCLGVPFATVVLADNQELNCKFLERKNISINLGWHNKLNPKEIKIKLSDLIDDYKRRTIMSKNGRELVDGMGTERVSDEILG